MLESLFGIAMLFAMAFAVIWVSEQISWYMHNENIIEEEEDFGLEPLFK